MIPHKHRSPEQIAERERYAFEVLRMLISAQRHIDLHNEDQLRKLAKLACILTDETFTQLQTEHAE